MSLKIIGQDGGFIEFEFIGAEDEGSYETVWLAITFSDDGFSGQTAVAFFRGELQNFATELQILETKRQGVAVLKCMSHLNEYADIDFKIHSIDKLGHMAATIKLQKMNYAWYNSAPLEVSGSFKIDPSSLPSILKDFQALAAAKRK